MSQVKPMLATDYDPAKVRYPVLASVKIDGVRMIIKDRVGYSRSMKPLPNKHLQAWVASLGSTGNGLDGEVVVGPENAKNVMQATMSGVMSPEGEPDFKFIVFDMWDREEGTPYRERNELAKNRIRAINGFTNRNRGRIERLAQFEIKNEAELLELEQKALAEGFEGLMIRDDVGRYKFGRSTVKGGELLKVKRFVDGEAEVIGVEEQMHNANEATINALGRTERSTRAEGLTPAGVLGALVVRDIKTGVIFNIGTGFTASDRVGLWKLHAAGRVIGKIAKYKSFAATGVKDAPRFPVFLGFRDERDL